MFLKQCITLVTMLSATTANTVAAAADLCVPGDYPTVQLACDAAEDGDRIVIATGRHIGQVRVDKSITLVGAGSKSTLIVGDKVIDKDSAVVTLADELHVALRDLAISDGPRGMLVGGGCTLELDRCAIRNHESDGMLFVDDASTYLWMKNCLVRDNSDGVDLESTQGVILDSEFVDNRDDGVDYDGEAGMLIANCTFRKNLDDGIEIRLASRTHAFVLNCTFDGCGEDGVEVIASPLPDTRAHVVSIQACKFIGNGRYGFGVVSVDDEVSPRQDVHAAVYAVGNEFKGNSIANVSPNYASVFSTTQKYPEIVHASIGQSDQNAVESNIAARIPILVGLYDPRSPTPGGVDGAFARDVEGVAVWGDRVYVADDSGYQIVVLDRTRGAIVDRYDAKQWVSGEPLPTPESCELIEGVNGHRLLVGDDNGGRIFSIPLSSDNRHRPDHQYDVKGLGVAEGCAWLNDALILTSGRSKMQLNLCDLTESRGMGEFTIRLDANGFCKTPHLAGIGVYHSRVPTADEQVVRVFATLSCLGDTNVDRRRNASAVVELNAKLSKVEQFWQLGPWSDDPRGVAMSDGLLYVADGRDYFTNTETGEQDTRGLKVFVFLLNDSGTAPELAAVRHLLPCRTNLGARIHSQ